MLEPIDSLPDGVVGFVASGQVSRDDYEQRMIPAVEGVLADHDKARMLYVFGPEFTGFSGGAMWEDGKLGVEHLTKWEKMAVVSDEKWVRHAIDVVGYLIPAKVRTFTLDERDAATAWISE